MIDNAEFLRPNSLKEPVGGIAADSFYLLLDRVEGIIKATIYHELPDLTESEYRQVTERITGQLEPHIIKTVPSNKAFKVVMDMIDELRSTNGDFTLHGGDTSYEEGI